MTAAVVALQAMLIGSEAQAQYMSARDQDRAIVRAFEDILDREPTDSELRRYRIRMDEDYWSERDVREDLESRSDYRHHSTRDEDPEKIIRRAYDDILHREPDREGLRSYRSKMIDDGWTERDVREALRKSAEYEKEKEESADKIIRRAYKDVFGREPDTNGLRSYRNEILHHGWDEHDVREALKRSPEYREKSKMSREDAEKIVRRAYLSVLNREPDDGSRGYVDKVLKDHGKEGDVARELKHSDEYRSKHP
jgi:TorA maturation chaperone TorD